MSKKIIVGFDAKRVVSNGTGLGNYGRTLVNDLSAFPCLDLHLYAPGEGHNKLRSQVKTADNLQFHFPHNAIFGTLWRTRGIVDDLKRDGIQVYHGLSGEVPMGLKKAGIKGVVTIHDLIFMRHPEFYNWIDTKIYIWKFHLALREADHIIAISERTKQDIIELGGADPSRITVIYQGFSPRFASSPVISRYRPPTPRYILSVGTVEQRKNILLAVKALHYLPPELSLVVVGRYTAYTDKVVDYVRHHNLENRVSILHGVSDGDLPALYAGAEAFVYPSIYEGFGIPIVEAISSGLPVVACTGSCLEEAGGPDSLYVDPHDPQAFAAALLQVLTGAKGREQRIARSREYIKKFEGRNVAAQVLEIYSKVTSAQHSY